MDSLDFAWRTKNFLWDEVAVKYTKKGVVCQEKKGHRWLPIQIKYVSLIMVGRRVQGSGLTTRSYSLSLDIGRKNCTEAWGTSAWTNYAISIPVTFLCSLPSGLSLRARRNTKIPALWILTEVNLNRADFHRHTFIKLVWSFEQRNSLTRFYPIGGQMLRSFQHVKRSARHLVPLDYSFYILLLFIPK